MTDQERFRFQPMSDDECPPCLDCGTEPGASDIAEFLRDDAVDQQKDGLNRTHLVYRDGEFVGFVSLAASNFRRQPGDPVPRLRYPDMPCLLVARLGVDRKFHRQGIGRQILSWVRGAATESGIGIRFLTLNVELENKVAQLVYEKEGFRELLRLRNRTHRFYYYDLYESPGAAT